MICRIKQISFQFLFEKFGVRDQSNVNGQAVPRSRCSDGERRSDETSLERGTTSLMSTGRLFHALGAVTENARSDETSLERGTTRSCLPAERREARFGMLAMGVTNSVRYDGARPLTAWNTKRQSLNN